jgi:hypothetical protein
VYLYDKKHYLLKREKSTWIRGRAKKKRGSVTCLVRMLAPNFKVRPVKRDDSYLIWQLP